MTRPSSIRFAIAGLLTLMACLLYLDRYALGIASESMRVDLRMTQTQVSLSFFAFFILRSVPGSRRLAQRSVRTASHVDRIYPWMVVVHCSVGRHNASRNGAAAATSLRCDSGGCVPGLLRDDPPLVSCRATRTCQFHRRDGRSIGGRPRTDSDCHADDGFRRKLQDLANPPAEQGSPVRTMKPFVQVLVDLPLDSPNRRVSERTVGDGGNHPRRGAGDQWIVAEAGVRSLQEDCKRR